MSGSQPASLGARIGRGKRSSRWGSLLVGPWVLAFVFVAGVSGSAEAERPPPPGGHGAPPHAGPRHKGAPLDRALEEVELPADVRADVDALLDESHRVRRDLKRSLRSARERMRELLEAEEPVESTILAQADEIGRLETALEKDRLRTLLRIRARLSPEQREALTRALESRRGRPPRPPR